MRPVGALILAAGASSRFGEPKQLLRIEAESLVSRAARAAGEAGCAPVAVVVGAGRDAIGRELEETSVLIVENAAWRSGLGTSIRCGLQVLVAGDPALEAVVILACDQPMVSSAVIRDLIEARERTGKPIVASSYAKTVGVPAIFDRSCFEALATLPEDIGAKRVIEARLDEVEQVPFEDGAIDIDTPADLQRFLGRSDSRG